MRPQVVRLDNVGTSQWLFVDPRRNQDFQVSLAVTLDVSSTLTYDVDLTYDLNTVERWQDVSIARVTTTATVTLIGHGLATGDNVQVFDTNFIGHNPESNLEGRFDVTVIDKDNFSYTVANTGQTSAIGRIISFRVFKHPTLQGDTAAEGGTQDSPVAAARLNVTAFTQGAATLTVLQQG